LGSVKAALSGSQTKAPGFAGGYLLPMSFQYLTLRDTHKF